MVTAAAGPQEIVANVYLGEHLHDEQDGIYEALGMSATRESRPTKEYPRGQEVYALTFERTTGSSTRVVEGGTGSSSGPE
jgi:hypothetical protein